jgi:Family of unknown function (DUF6278)
VRRSWRWWLPGSKRGLARGVAVVGYPVPTDPAALAELLGRADRLRAWAQQRGVELTGEPLDLRRLDRVIPQQDVSPDVAAWLPLDAGLYLGRLLVDHVNEATWTVRPNGHPVVRVPGHGDVDVTDISRRATATGGAGLWRAYQQLAT